MNKPPNEFITPLGYLVGELMDQLTIATHIDKSTTALNNTPGLLNTIKKIPEVYKQPVLMKAIKYIEEESLATIKHSEKILTNDFAKTNSQILVAMWNSLLTTIDNVQTKLLLKANVRQNIVASANLSKRWQNQLPNEIDEDELRYFLKCWQTSGTNIVEYIENKWEFFDLKSDIPADLKSGLIEMHQIRNCLVHRAGVADKKLTQGAPSLNLGIGDQLIISRDILLKYHKVAGDYGMSLFTRMPNCKYFYIKPKS